jgi:integrase
MKHRALTEAIARGLKPKDHRYTISEDGLTIEVHPSGKKTLYSKYREHGVQRKELLGEYHPERFTIKDARTKVIELRHRLEVLQAPVRQTAMTLKEFLEGPFKEYIEGSRRDSKGTMTRLKYHFVTSRPDLGNTKLRSLTEQQIDLWKVNAKATRKAATVNRAFGDLRAALNLAVKWQHIRTSPCAGIKPFAVDDEAEKLYLDGDEFSRLEKAAEQWEFLSHFGKPRERLAYPRWFLLWLRIVLNTGGRKGEVLSLRWADVDRKNRMITFRGVRTKNERTRRVPITAKLLKHIEDFYAEEHEDAERDEEGVIIGAPLERIFPADSLRKPWARLHALAKLPAEVTPHTLRHHVASTMVLKGAALPIVRDLLGHRSLEVTSRYLKVRTADSLQALELL